MSKKEKKNKTIPWKRISITFERFLLMLQEVFLLLCLLSYLLCWSKYLIRFLLEIFLWCDVNKSSRIKFFDDGEKIEENSFFTYYVATSDALLRENMVINFSWLRGKENFRRKWLRRKIDRMPLGFWFHNKLHSTFANLHNHYCKWCEMTNYSAQLFKGKH